MQQKTEKDQKDNGNLTYTNRETDPTVSILQWDDQKDKTFREKSESSKKVISREMMCFKIIKLVYNNSIYTKTFLILK